MYNNPALVAARIMQVSPSKSATVIKTEYGEAVKVTGTGAKVTAEYYNRERYLDGFVDTQWKTVRHGIGYLIPFYENPLNRIL